MGEITHISGLTPDPANRRKHGPKNTGMMVDALHEVGFARSIVVDEAGVILAGNGIVEAAAEAGIERVQVVEADGETIVAVRRTNLTPAQKTRLALFDNRAAELAEWDLELLAQDLTDTPDLLTSLWQPEELEALLGGLVNGAQIPDGFREFDANTFDGVEDEWSEMKFRVPLGAVPIIEAQVERIAEACRLKEKSLALRVMALTVAELPDEQLCADRHIPV